MKITPYIALITAFLYTLAVSFSQVSLNALIPIFFLIYLFKDELKKVLKKLLFLNIFIVVLALVLVFQKEYFEALNIFLRSNLIIFFNLLIFSSSKGYDIVRGFYILRFPDAFVSIIYFTIKMIDNLTNDFKNIRNTLKTRGFKAKTTMFTYETFGNILGLLFVNSIRKSQSLKDSFTARGFQGKIYLNDEVKISSNDYTLLGLVGFMILLKVVL